MKTEVYTWRIPPALKTSLEREARRRKISMAAALDLAAREWLDKTGIASDGEEEQLRLQSSASRFLGALASANPRRAESASQTLRQRLRRRHGR